MGTADAGGWGTGIIGIDAAARRTAAATQPRATAGPCRREAGRHQSRTPGGFADGRTHGSGVVRGHGGRYQLMERPYGRRAQLRAHSPRRRNNDVPDAHWQEIENAAVTGL